MLYSMGSIASAAFDLFAFVHLADCTWFAGTNLEVLNSRNTWVGKAGEDAGLKKLAKMFLDDFKAFALRDESRARVAVCRRFQGVSRCRRAVQQEKIVDIGPLTWYYLESETGPTAPRRCRPTRQRTRRGTAVAEQEGEQSS